MKSEICIRLATLADAPKLLEIHHTSILALAHQDIARGGGMFSQAQLYGWVNKATMATMEADIQPTSDQSMYVATIGLEAVGYVMVIRQEIARLFASPNISGCGVGKTLLRYAESIISQRYTNAEIEAIASAVSFYVANGYGPHPQHVVPILNSLGDGVSIETVWLRKELR